MSRVVWKFPIEIGQITEIELPHIAVVRLFALDPATGHTAIWVELDPDAKRVARRFEVFGTGHAIEGNGGYPSPIHCRSMIQGPFVWHLFEHRQ